MEREVLCTWEGRAVHRIRSAKGGRVSLSAVAESVGEDCGPGPQPRARGEFCTDAGALGWLHLQREGPECDTKRTPRTTHCKARGMLGRGGGTDCAVV